MSLFATGTRLSLVAQSIGRLAGAWSGVPAICLGNGSSREGLDLGRLPERGRAFVIGCNRIYETMSDRLDALVSLDEAMAVEVMERAEIRGPLVFRGGVLRTKHLEALRPGAWSIGLPRQATELVSSASGVMSVAVAMAAGCSPVYTIGHDLEPGSTVYRGAECYDKGATEPGAYKVDVWRNDLRSFVGEYSGHLFQVETERVPGAVRISWDDLLDRFAGERVEVVT